MKNTVLILPNNHPHLKYKVISNGKLVGEHASLETCEKHKAKILKSNS